MGCSQNVPGKSAKITAVKRATSGHKNRHAKKLIPETNGLTENTKPKTSEQCFGGRKVVSLCAFYDFYAFCYLDKESIVLFQKFYLKSILLYDKIASNYT